MHANKQLLGLNTKYVFFQGLNPFYIFQLFSLLLWTAGEGYYYYAGVIGFLTIVSLTAQIYQQRQVQMETIHLCRMAKEHGWMFNKA